MAPITNYRKLDESSSASKTNVGRKMGVGFAGAAKATAGLAAQRRTMKQSMTSGNLMDGGAIARARRSIKTADGAEIRFGLGIADDMRLRSILERESFFLNVLDPRIASFGQAIRALASYFQGGRVWLLLALLSLYVYVGVHCAQHEDFTGEDTFCSGGPTGIGFSDYRPVILNSVAGLLLSFYSNFVVQEYKSAVSDDLQSHLRTALPQYPLSMHRLLPLTLKCFGSRTMPYPVPRLPECKATHR